MAYYRRSWLEGPVRQRDMSLRRLAVRCNKGGIGEAYARGDVGECVAMDADSLYPRSAIALGGLPRDSADWTWCPTGDGPPAGTEGVCKVRFAFPPDTMYPCLPVVEDGRMLFPLAGISHCTIAEVRAALKMGATVRWMACAYYDPARADPSFGDMLSALLNEKARCEKRGDKAGRLAAKNLANCVIGKLSQRSKGMASTDLPALAEELGVPLAEVAKASFRDPKKTIHETGPFWMPEWHALILGKARAIMAPIIAVGSVVTSTDSVVLPVAAAAAVPWRRAAVPFKEEARGPTFVVRPRVYRVGDKVAHHAVHSRRAALPIILAVGPGRTRYTARKSGTLRDEMAGVRPMGQDYRRRMQYDGAWPDKRCLLEGGSTRPWADVLERRLARMAK
jgi:hypothetical protein